MPLSYSVKYVTWCVIYRGDSTHNWAFDNIKNIDWLVICCNSYASKHRLLIKARERILSSCFMFCKCFNQSLSYFSGSFLMVNGIIVGKSVD